MHPKELEVLDRLDPFRDHPEPESVGEGQDRADDGGVVRVDRQVPDELLRHLEGVERQPLQVSERRVARAEVVDGEPHAEPAQLGEET